MMGLNRLKLLAAALLFALAMPLGQAEAGISDGTVSADATTSAPIALPAEATAAAEKPIVVAGNKNKNKNWNKAYNKNWNKNWKYNNKKVVVVRPYRKWYKRPYYGTVIGGVALGAILGAAAYGAGPPGPNTCWYWADPYQTQGYWDYCY
jgi:hypothetical protein